MKLSSNGIELLKRFEGLALEAYQDIAGVWTIGYGHTGPDVKPGMRITESEAEELLRRDISPRENAVARLASVSLNRNEFDALVSFVYNIGVDAFRRSTPLRRLNRGDRLGAADALAWWNKATIGGRLREVIGLTRRRAAERALFLTPTTPLIFGEPDNVEEDTRATPVEAPPRRTGIAESRTVQGATVAGGAGVAASSMQGDSSGPARQAGGPAAGGASDGAPSSNSANGDQSVAVDSDGNVTLGEETGGEESGGEETGDTEEIILDTGDMPTREDVTAVEAQIQFALLILIVLSVLFVIYARFDDWRNYRR